jgi:hypothetical protein
MNQPYHGFSVVISRRVLLAILTSGALCDSAQADDTNAVLKAIAAAAGHTPSCVRFERGEYLLSGPWHGPVEHNLIYRNQVVDGGGCATWSSDSPH